MARLPAQRYGEVRDGLVMYEGGTTWHYLVRWRGKIKRGDTKSQSRTVALEWLRKEKEIWAKEEHDGPLIRPWTMRALWEEWDRVKASSVSASHRRYMAGCVRLHLGEWLDRNVSELNQAAIEHLRDAYLTSDGEGHKKGGGHTKRTHSEGGWNKCLAQFHALCGWAVSTGRLKAVQFKLDRIAVSHFSKSVLWPEQVKGFLAAVDGIRKERKGDPVPHAGILARLMLTLGLRENEACGLEWDRVDWRRNVAIIAMVRTTGKKVKDRTIREIPMHPNLVAYLRVWWEHEDKPTKGLVMIARNGKAHGAGATKKAVAIGAEVLHLTGFTPHGLRRTFATGHFEVGTPLTQIAQMMGHDDPVITMRHYIVQRPKDQHDAQAKLAAVMGFE